MCTYADEGTCFLFQDVCRAMRCLFFDACEILRRPLLGSSVIASMCANFRAGPFSCVSEDVLLIALSMMQVSDGSTSLLPKAPGFCIG